MEYLEFNEPQDTIKNVCRAFPLQFVAEFDHFVVRLPAVRNTPIEHNPNKTRINGVTVFASCILLLLADNLQELACRDVDCLVSAVGYKPKPSGKSLLKWQMKNTAHEEDNVNFYSTPQNLDAVSDLCRTQIGYFRDDLTD